MSNIVICKLVCNFNEVIPACRSGVCIHKEVVDMDPKDIKKFNKYDCPYRDQRREEAEEKEEIEE